MEGQSQLRIVLDFLVALGSILIAVLAIWGDWFRNRFAGPKLSVSLRSSRGELTETKNGAKVLHFHLDLKNKRRWVLARGVQVMIRAIWRKAADGTYKPEQISADLPVTWAFPEFSPVSPAVRDTRLCDLASLRQGATYVEPKLYFYPNNFTGNIGRGESVRFGIGIQAENFTSRELLVAEISWDGQWSDDLDRMEKHLVVKEVERTTSKT